MRGEEPLQGCSLVEQPLQVGGCSTSTGGGPWRRRAWVGGGGGHAERS